jgi:hypothetical protein
MIRTVRKSVLTAAVLAGFCASASASGLEFEARLTGAQEVPAVTTTQVGELEVEFDTGFTQAEFTLSVFNGVGVTQAHFHCQRAGQNGPVVAFLYGFGPTVDVHGVLSAGTLTNASFTGADCVPHIGRPINNIAALAFAMRDGLIYANVHTVAHPPGETRGQLVAEDDCDRDGDSDRDDRSDDDSGSGSHSAATAAPRNGAARLSRDR